MEGSYNICGAASPAIDVMIAAVVAARGHDDFVAAVRALDRVLLSGFYIVPLFYSPDQWIAYSSALGRPERTPMFGVSIESWWRAVPSIGRRRVASRPDGSPYWPRGSGARRRDGGRYERGRGKP